ncbi:MAG: hypothetical protein KDC80_12550 [Saprospiraceae bacterium]|nr:hypothetical protein [Saprospiraceae bacterium]
MISDPEIEGYLEESELFLRCNGADVLAPVCTEINSKQPEFTPIAYSWNGLTVEQVELLYETILVLYYALSKLAKINLPTFRRHTITQNVKDFTSFIRYINLEAKDNQADVGSFRFIQNPVLLKYAASCLNMIEDLPATTVGSYMAIIKAIDDHLTNNQR